MNKFVLTVTACLALAACNEKKVYTVDEFLADHDQIVKVLKECNNNPGELERGANCQNAKAALRAMPFNEARILIRQADGK